MLKADHDLSARYARVPSPSFAGRQTAGPAKSEQISASRCAASRTAANAVCSICHSASPSSCGRRIKDDSPRPAECREQGILCAGAREEIEDGRGGTEAYEKTDEKARELLRRLANSEPYFKKARWTAGAEGEGSGSGNMKALTDGGPGPIRTRDSRGGAATPRGAGRGGRGGARGGRAFPSAAQLPPGPEDTLLPPADQSIMSLFVTGVEDDLPEHKIRDFFTVYGKLRSLGVLTYEPLRLY